MTANHALQRTRPALASLQSLRPAAGSLSLGRSVTSTRSPLCISACW